MNFHQSDGHPSITEDVRRALLEGGRIASVYSHKGGPGGYNNDCLMFTMESGAVIDFDIYSLYPLAVTVQKGPS